MTAENAKKRGYHHGNLAESLLDAVDELASQFGLEAVTLRGCAKLAGVSPSSAFRHYADKRALLTAFATRALRMLTAKMSESSERGKLEGSDPFLAVGLAYIEFALDKPAFFRAMWQEGAIYSNDPEYVEAAGALALHLKGGFADSMEDDDAGRFSARELLAWSAVHGLAGLFVDGPVARDRGRREKMAMASEMLRTMNPALSGRD